MHQENLDVFLGVRLSFTVKDQKDLFSLPLAGLFLVTVNFSKYLPWIVCHDTPDASSLLCSWKTLNWMRKSSYKKVDIYFSAHGEFRE